MQLCSAYTRGLPHLWLLHGTDRRGEQRGRVLSKIALLFPGQGAQTVGMGREVFEKVPAARELFERANEVLGYDLKILCFEGPAEALTETKVCQPALYVQGFALFSMLQEAGKLDDVTAACGLRWRAGNIGPGRNARLASRVGI